MSIDYKNIIKKEIQKNDCVCDLSDVDLNEENLNYIYERILQNPNIGFIKWKSDEPSNELKPLKEKIEKRLILNNKNYRSFPDEYVHCLLAHHCINTEFKDDYKNDKTLFDKEKYKFLKKHKWKVYEVFKLEEYKSVLYINYHTKNLILAFQGINLKIKDLFLGDGQINSLINSMIANQQIASHTFFSYKHTESAVQLCKEKKNGYSLSFTGYAFGAWLAEQAVYFSMKDFDFFNVKAITFDSPGSYEYLTILNDSNIYSSESDFKISHLNIETYLSAPNFMNTCNKHIGRVYRLFTNSKHLFDSKIIDEKQRNIIKELVESIPFEKVKKLVKKCYQDKIEANLKRYSFYINGFISIFHDGLSLILNEFDENTHKPFRYYKMLDWPKVIFKSSANFNDNYKVIFNTKHLIDLIPDFGIVPSKIKELISKGANFIINKGVELIADNFLDGIKVIVNFMIEIYNGNLNNDQCLDCFQYDENIYEYNNGKRELEIENKFKLTYFAHYGTSEINLYEDELIFRNEGSIDHFLYNLFYHTKDKQDLNSLDNIFIRNQLFELRNLYELDSYNYKMIIKAIEDEDNNKVEIDLIRYRLKRLLEISNNLKKFLHDLISTRIKTNNWSIDITNDEILSDSNFVGRIKEIEQIEEELKIKQYVYLAGESAVGKSTLARQFLKRIKDNSNQIVKWIHSHNEFISRIRSFAIDSLKLNSNDNPEDLIRNMKIVLNKYVETNNLKLLFIIDDLEYNEKNEFNYMLTNFNKNIKFLITTKNDKIDQDIKKEYDYSVIKLKRFDEIDCMEYIKKNLIEQNMFIENDWKEIFEIIGENGNILPIEIENLIGKINNEPFWDRNDIITYATTEKENQFYELNLKKKHLRFYASYHF